MIRDMISEVITLLQTISDNFYQRQDKEAYSKLDTVIEKLSALMEQLLTDYQSNPQVVASCNQMLSSFAEALQALQIKDTILLADILTFEIKERLNLLMEDVI